MARQDGCTCGNNPNPAHLVGCPVRPMRRMTDDISPEMLLGQRPMPMRSGGMTVEQALREALAAYDAAIVLDPSKGYHFGSGPSIEELAKSIAARLGVR